MIRKYYRRRKHGGWHPRGLIVAQTNGNELKVGFSLCAPVDPFNRKTANIMAINRMDSGRYIADITDEESIDKLFEKIPFTLHERLGSLIFHIKKPKVLKEENYN